MAGTKFTPGPWGWDGERLVGLKGPVLDYAAYEGMWFARYDADEDTANAHLIAAAPDLYEALSLFLEVAEAFSEEGSPLPSDGPSFDRARTALAKARGET